MSITKINSLGINLTSPTTFSAGTAALPSITFSGDTNTGVFAPAADTIGFAEGGTEAMRIDANGSLMIGGTSGTVHPTLNKFVSLQSSTDTNVIGYNLFVNDGVNNRRGSLFLDDNAGTFGLAVTAGSGVPAMTFGVPSEAMRIISAGNLRFPALTTGSSASSTAYLLDTTYPNALIFVAGQENLPVNMSFYMGIAVRSASTYTLTQIAKPSHGNGFGTVNVAMNGNYLNISYAAGSGNYAVNVFYFFG